MPINQGNAPFYDRWSAILLLIGLVVRGAIAYVLPVGFDEAYYYLYTQHLDWSYFDHPLLVALATGLGVWITGQATPFTLRWGALLLHTGALWFIYLTGKRLFAARTGWLTLAIASLVPIFMVGFGVMTLPDAPLMFFWAATLYIAAWEFFPEASESTSSPFTYRPGPRLALLGLLVGLACLGKYHGAALGLGLLGFCLTQRPYWRVFTSPWLVVSAGLFSLAIAPILVWNAQYDWVSLRFQSGRAIPAQGYHLLDLLGTWLAGVAYLFPSFGLPLWWVSGKALWQQISGSQRHSKPSPENALLLWMSLPLMILFTLMGGYRPILPTWVTPGFWSATLLLGAAASQISRRWVWRWLVGSAAAIAPILLLALLHLNLGILQKPSQFALAGGFLPPATDASTQQISIHQLRTQLAQLNLAEQGDFLFTNDIFLAGQVALAIAPLPQRPITCLDPDPRGFAFWSTASEWVGQRGVLITRAEQAERAIRQYQPYFATFQKVADLPLQRGGVVVQTLQIYQAGPLLRPYPRPYGKSSAE